MRICIEQGPTLPFARWRQACGEMAEMNKAEKAAFVWKSIDLRQSQEQRAYVL
jgi:hypothetical protein